MSPAGTCPMDSSSSESFTHRQAGFTSCLYLIYLLPQAFQWLGLPSSEFDLTSPYPSLSLELMGELNTLGSICSQEKSSLPAMPLSGEGAVRHTQRSRCLVFCEAMRLQWILPDCIYSLTIVTAFVGQITRRQ